MAVVQPAPDSSISEVICTNLDYAQYSVYQSEVSMATDTTDSRTRRGHSATVRLGSVRAVVRRSSVRWRSPETVGHEAADMAAQALGLSRRRCTFLIRRARQGS